MTREPAGYATGPPPPAGVMRRCACGAAYRDHPGGHDSHKTVFGHRPIERPAPQPDSEANT